jgi:hypothetical protein
MKIKTSIKAGAGAVHHTNHNQTAVRGLKVKTNVKAGHSDGPGNGGTVNHNQTAVRA